MIFEVYPHFPSICILQFVLMKCITAPNVTLFSRSTRISRRPGALSRSPMVASLDSQKCHWTLSLHHHHPKYQILNNTNINRTNQVTNYNLLNFSLFLSPISSAHFNHFSSMNFSLMASHFSHDLQFWKCCAYFMFPKKFGCSIELSASDLFRSQLLTITFSLLISIIVTIFLPPKNVTVPGPPKIECLFAF